MEKKFIRFVLTKEDADLIGWKNSLPPRSINEAISHLRVSNDSPCGGSGSENLNTQNRLVFRLPW